MALIHILDRKHEGGITVSAAFHVPVEDGEDRARLAAEKPASVVPNLSEDEGDDISFGRTVEVVRTMRFDLGTGKAEVQEALRQVHQNMCVRCVPGILEELAESAGLVGASFDGSIWSK